MENTEKSTKKYPTKREQFYALIKERVAKQLDLVVTDTYFTYKVAVKPKKIYLVPSLSNGGLLLVLSSATFRETVYGNSQEKLEEIIQSYEMIAATQLYEPESERICFGKTMKITSETTQESVLKFWCNN